MKHLRKIPAVMFSQHPDHASKPYWLNSSFIRTHQELEECYRMFKELGTEEMMWDWEGKLVDECVVEKLLGKYSDFFQNYPIGEKLFLTFRVPNPRVESGYRLGRAFMVILSGQHLAYAAGFSSPPLFEVIIPMVENADEIYSVQKSFQQFSKVAANSFGSNGFGRNLEVIPTFESVETILRSAKILKEYLKISKGQVWEKISYLRPFCARSDPALNSGIVPTTLAIKWALSEYSKLAKETGVDVYPIIAPGVLPFRGGLSPENTNEFLREFPGVKTVVIQSAFRYDFPRDGVKSAIGLIIRHAPKTESNILPGRVLNEIKSIIPMFEGPYKKTVEKIAPLIEQISIHIPPRRERVQHIGLFGYSRAVGKVRLPRAIGFTASCYSLGIPPRTNWYWEGNTTC
ncbi:phosphoenolpyruvate carboxylase [Candidatus Gottesmanbacteria bacterium]|nr:phosphoenolpyruvate carboxylase [Candidatus Gottesmanbacteria bacterium]